MDVVNQNNVGRLAWNKGKAEPALLVQCKRCLQLHVTKNKYCSDLCKNKAMSELAKSKRSVLRMAVEEGFHELVLDEIRKKSQVDDQGCWIWPNLKDGYPIIRNAWRGRQIAVHRLVLEAKHGKPLGSQAAHHVCAVTACVNPEHLQPVTHRDNVAEMLQRHSYLDRIAELEAALQEIDPSHPVLHRIKVA